MARQPEWEYAYSLLKFRDQPQDTPHSVGLHWTSDGPVTETST